MNTGWCHTVLVSRDRGFTLVETLVAVLLTSLLMVGVLNFSFGLARTYHAADGLHRLQRELVFSAERIYQVLKIAGEVEGTSGVYRATGVKYHTGGASLPGNETVIELTGTNLMIGGRRYASHVASLDISRPPSGETDLRRVVITSVSSFGLVPSSRLPLSIAIDVKLRNYHLDPNLVGPPSVQVSSDSVTVSWSTADTALGKLWYGVAPNQLVEWPDTSYGTTHSITIRDLPLGTTFYYRVWGRTDENPPYEYMSNRIYMFATDEIF